MKAAAAPELASAPANAELLAEQTSEPASEPSRGRPRAPTATPSIRRSASSSTAATRDHSLDPDAYAAQRLSAGRRRRPSAQGFSLGESEISLRRQHRRQVLWPADAGDRQRGRRDRTRRRGSLHRHHVAARRTSALRAGRFFSNIGYLNSHHAHTDKFFDRPLAYQAFLGNQYGDDGVQLRWVAPTDLFVELGGEVFRGAELSQRRRAVTAAAARARCSRMPAAMSATRTHGWPACRCSRLEHRWRRGWLQRRQHALHRRRHLEVGARRATSRMAA